MNGIKQRGIYGMIEDMPTTTRAVNELGILKSLVTAIRDEVATGRASRELAVCLRAYEITVEGKE